MSENEDNLDGFEDGDDSDDLHDALSSGDIERIRALIAAGANIHYKRKHGYDALIDAVHGRDTARDLECMNILIDAGAKVEADEYGSILGRTTSRKIVLRLLDAGADPANLSHSAQRSLLDLGEVDATPLQAVSSDDFRLGHKRVFGKTNPERMQVPFWEAMIRAGVGAYTAWDRFGESCNDVTRPVWCAQRYGQSVTFLPDGRAIQIGGEHEDYYDADFCIYNDVFVYEKDGSIAIYGYPESVFPPTDFHTATLLGEFIYVVGSAGYQQTRQFETTLVFRLHVPTLRINRVDTHGDTPGAIYNHRALPINSHEIRIWGGKIMTKNGDQEDVGDNREIFVLDVESRLWRRENKTSADN